MPDRRTRITRTAVRGRALRENDGSRGAARSLAAWQRAARVFTAAVDAGRADLPRPGSGATWQRWAALADLAGEDLSLVRLCEGHADAVAILAEFGGPRPRSGSRWGVWTASPPGPSLTASRRGDAWVLDGTKQYCSGARVCTDALVTASAEDGTRLFAVVNRRRPARPQRAGRPAGASRPGGRRRGGE